VEPFREGGLKPFPWRVILTEPYLEFIHPASYQIRDRLVKFLLYTFFLNINPGNCQKKGAFCTKKKIALDNSYVYFFVTLFFLELDIVTEEENRITDTGIFFANFMKESRYPLGSVSVLLVLRIDCTMQ